jgi:hypothetical protein
MGIGPEILPLIEEFLDLDRLDPDFQRLGMVSLLFLLT